MGGSNKKGPISEINVTPLVDVMLVLLIIFMVTAPMMFNGIQLKLPKTKKVSSLNLTGELVVLSITEKEEYYLGKQKIAHSRVLSKIIESFKINKTDVLYLRADYSLKYEKVARFISELKKAGIGNISLVTETDKN